MGWKVGSAAALAACAMVFLGSATASAPAGPTSAVKQLGFIKKAASVPHPALRAAKTAAAPSNYAIDPTLQLTYHGGPVMHTHRVTLIFWIPNGYQYGSTSGDSTTYENDIIHFVQDVAADSGKTSSAFGAISQYKDAGGPAQYNVTYGGDVVDTTAFPVAGDCPDAGTCLTDQILITEIDKFAGTGGLADQYALFLPNGVVTCTDQTNDVCSNNFFCAYHSAYNHGPGTTPFIYLNLPYESDVGCHSPDGVNVQPEPNAPSNADTTIDDMSHEEREAATDPLGSAWFDANGNEADDKCIDTYGSNLSPSNDFNQLINGHHYDTQTEWSNLKKGCYQMGAPTVSLDSTSVVEEAPIGITGTNFFTSSPGKPIVKFNGITATVETVDSPTHLTVGVPDGNTNGKVTVQAIGGTGTATQLFGLKPNISGLSDSHDVTGTKITVNGTGFFGVKSVKFGTVAGVFSSVATDGGSLKVIVPAGATTGNLTVTTAGGTSDPADFTVTPHIASFTPASAKGLTNVSIVGTGLNGVTGVDFNGDASPLIVSASALKVVAEVPDDATMGPITVTNSTETSAPSAGSFKPLPFIASFTPTDGATPMNVTITGGELGDATVVKFGTFAASHDPPSATSIVAAVPSGFSTGKVTVVTPEGTAISTQTFSITKVTSVAPLTAAAGATVTITGQGLGSTTSVDFNGHAAQPVSGTPTATSVKVVVPPDAKPGPLTVNTPRANSTTATFKPLPRITGFENNPNQAGGTITVDGTNLDAGGTPTAKLGTVAVTPTGVGSSAFQFVVPDNAVSNVLTYTNPDGTTASLTKVLIRPRIDGDPDQNNVIAGTKIMLTGKTFTGTTSVKFGGDTHGATFLIGGGGTTLTVTVPATGMSGKIAVTNAGGTTQTGSDFTLKPFIKSFTPTSAPVGATITVTGTGLLGAEGVMLGGPTGATPTNITATGFKFVVPQGATTDQLAVETSNNGVDGYSDPSAGTLTITATLASFSPAGGVSGTVVTITGVGFTGATAVSFGGTAATTFSVDSDTQITATVPDGAGDGVISVTRPTAPTSLLSATEFKVPTISGFADSTVSPGDDLEIDGTDLAGATLVTFHGGATAVPTSATATVVHVTVPEDAHSGTVTVTTADFGDVASSGSLTVQFTLEVHVSGAATSEVTSDVGGIACFGDGSGTCSVLVNDGATVNLTAIPGGIDVFVNWNGGPFFIVTANPAQFTMSADYKTGSSAGRVVATFSG